jgi:signal transduction histidine kinase
LRTPLTSLFGWTRLLRSANLEPKNTSRALEAIERSVRKQRRLVEDLLDVSRMIAGKLRLEPAPVKMNAIIETAIEELRSLAEAKNISIDFNMESKTANLCADPNRLGQVLWHILSNAIKFTPCGGRIDIRLHCAKSEIIISVADTGEGISSDFLPYVFDRFRQADATSTRKHGGLGLGLAIVKHLVEMHNGSVHAESPGKGAGSTFTVRLPVIDGDAAGKIANTPQLESPRLNA